MALKVVLAVLALALAGMYSSIAEDVFHGRTPAGITMIGAIFWTAIFCYLLRRLYRK